MRQNAGNIARAVFSFSFLLTAPISSFAAVPQTSQKVKEEPFNHHEEEINVHAERHEDPSCPVSIRKGVILGASHGTHTEYLPTVNIPYRERFTFFSVADGAKTYLVRRQGVLHVKDYVGVIVSAPCRETIAEVARIGGLKEKGINKPAE